MSKSEKYVYHMLPCSRFDMERVESWLSDMAKEGLLLVGVTFFFGLFKFKKGRPQTVRYRLEPMQKGDDELDEPDTDIKALCEEYGWEYVASCTPFFIYRTSRHDAREMNTDLVVQSEALNTLRRQFLVALPLQLFVFGHSMYRVLKEPFRYLATFGSFYTFGYVCFMIGAIIYDIKHVRHILKLQKKLKSNTPLDHEKPWKNHSALYRTSKILIAVFSIVLLCTMITQCSTAFTREGTPLEKYKEDPPFVTIADLFPDGNYTPQEMSGYNEFLQWDSDFAPVYLEWEEYGQITTADGKMYSGFLVVDYVKTTSGFLAQGLAADYIRRDKEYKNFEEIQIPDFGLDYAIAYEGPVCPIVVLRQGCILVRATILIDNVQGENLHLLWAEQMAERLK